MKRPVYTIFNIIYLIIILWCLLYANTYLNDLIVGSLKGNSLIYVSIRSFLLLAEAVGLIMIAYGINKAILSDTENKVSRNLIANKTLKGQVIVVICFIGTLVWVIFKDFL